MYLNCWNRKSIGVRLSNLLFSLPVLLLNIGMGVRKLLYVPVRITEIQITDFPLPHKLRTYVCMYVFLNLLILPLVPRLNAHVESYLFVVFVSEMITE